MSTTALGTWREARRVPEMAIRLAEGEMKRDTRGVWWARPVGAGKILRFFKVGAGGNTVVGSQQGDAVIVSAAYAENAQSGWGPPTVPDTVGANDVYDLVTPDGDITGINDTVYVQFKSPPNAQIWKAVPQGQDVAYFPATGVDQTKLQPVPSSPGGVTPGGGGPTITPAQTPKSTFMKALPWVLGAAGLATVGVVGYKMMKHKKRRAKR